MYGISVRYEYDGPEQPWENVINAFIDAVNADTELAGRFDYQVNIGRDGKSRVHWGRWDEPATVERLQSRAYFREFSEALKTFAGDSLSPMPVAMYRRSD